jgi:hypothetical protein
MSFEGYVHLEDVDVLKETDSAFLLLIEGGEKVWMPKSQVADPDGYAEGDEGVSISITEWIADQKGIG